MRAASKYLIAFSIIPLIVINRVLAHYPEFIERYYSHGLYVYLSKMMRFTFGWLPFSIGDLLYTFAIFYALRWLFRHRKRLLTDPKSWILEVLSALSIGYISFHLLWAFNYYREPLHKALALEKNYTTEALISLTKQLAEKTNATQLKITNNDSIKVAVPYLKSELLNMVPSGYKALAKVYPHLEYVPKSIKKSIYSTPLTYMGFSGYLNPFTNEAQIDGLIPLFRYPTTASHEVAHQLGYAAENEANFIGTIATLHHNDIYFRYSGYTFALQHCLNELYVRDFKTYETIVATLHKGVLKNYREVNDFWKAYKNPLEPFFKSTYDGYLKANNQADGMRSYSYVVALLVNYAEKHEL